MLFLEKKDILCPVMRTRATAETITHQSHKGLFKLAWISLLATAVLLVIAAGIAFYIGQTLGTFVSFLNIIGTSYMLAIIGHAMLTVGIALLIPVMVALFFALRDANMGRAAAGTGLGMSGIFVFLANTGNYFWLIALAQGYTRICTTGCQQLYQQEAYAANSVTLDLFTAQLLFAIAILIISWTMMKTASFGKNPAYLGILSGAYAIAAPLVVLSTNSDPNFVLTSYPATFALVLYAIWFALVATKLRPLSK
jgi:uncharacterized protein DUF4386